MPEFNGLIENRYVPAVPVSAPKFNSYWLGASWKSGNVNDDEMSIFETVPSVLVRSNVKSLLSTPLTASLKLMMADAGWLLRGESI